MSLLRSSSVFGGSVLLCNLRSKLKLFQVAAMSDDSQTCSLDTNPADELELRDDLRYVELLQQHGVALYAAVPEEIKDCFSRPVFYFPP